MERRFEHLRIWAWRYRSVRSSEAFYVHLMANREAWDTMIASLLSMTAAAGNGRRTFPARELPVQHDPTGFSESYIWFSKFRMEVVRDDESLKQMHLSVAEDAVTLAVNPAFTGEIVAAFDSVRRGGSDFGFGPKTDRRSPFGLGARDRESLFLMFWQPLRGTE